VINDSQCQKSLGEQTRHLEHNGVLKLDKVSHCQGGDMTFTVFKH